MTENKNNLTEGPILKTVLVLAFPIVAANLMQTMYQLIDTFWLGRLGPVAIAAVSLSFPILFFLIALGGGLSIAGTILVAQYKGKKEKGNVDYVAAQTVMIMFFLSLILSLVGFAFAPQVIKLMGVEEAVYAGAVSYLRISFIGVVFVFSFFVFQSLMRGVGNAKTPLYLVTGTVLLNLLLDPLFIFGFGPIKAMGISGAAIATIITQGLAAVIGLWILFSGKYGIHLKKKNLVWDFSLIRKLFKLGLPASIEQSSRALAITFITFLVTGFGTSVIAAYGIGTKILGFAIIPALGFSVANSTLVGQAMGAGKIERAEKASKVTSLVAFASLSLLGMLVFFLAEPICALFSPNSGLVLEMSVEFVRLNALFFGFIGLQQVFNGTFGGSGNTFTSMLLAILGLWVLRLPLVYFLSRHTSLSYRGIWWAFPASTLVAALTAWLWFKRGSWKKKRITEEIKLVEKTAEETTIEEGVI